MSTVTNDMSVGLVIARTFMSTNLSVAKAFFAPTLFGKCNI
jgi:hypothetical protein